jgi:hypothetical protein
MFKTKIMVPALLQYRPDFGGFTFGLINSHLCQEELCYTTVSCVSLDRSVVGASIGTGLCYWRSLTCNRRQYLGYYSIR